jgi:hypothetical protein
MDAPNPGQAVMQSTKSSAGRLLATGLLATGLLAAGLVAGCGSPEVTRPAATRDVAGPHVGRSVCPGAVPWVATNLRGAPADALEQLQGTYEQDPGFLAVVFDGTKPIVIVEAARLAEWQLRLAPHGVAAARSCVDPALLAAVHAVLPMVRPQAGMIITAGYDGLDDSIFVIGIDADTLVSTLDKQSPGTGSAALAAIADGTLRIDPQQIQETR